MKLAVLRQHDGDGRLIVLSRDLSRYQTVSGIARTLPWALDNWQSVAPELDEVYTALNHGAARHAQPFDSGQCQEFALQGGLPREIATASVGLVAVTGNLPRGAEPATCRAALRLLLLAGHKGRAAHGASVALSPVAAAPGAFEGFFASLRLRMHCDGAYVHEKWLPPDLGSVLSEWLAALAATRMLKAGSPLFFPLLRADEIPVASAFACGRGLSVEIVSADGESLFGSLDLPEAVA